MIKVLIAEDEPPIARAISRMVGELSRTFSVSACVSNGVEAIDHMRRDPADVVFTDIRMPVMDGLELLIALRADWPDCQVVILSGHQDFAYSQTAIRLGAFDYLLKPISREKLRDLLERLEDAHARFLLQEAVGSWRAGGQAPPAGFTVAKDVTCALILAIAGHWPNIADDGLSPGAVFWQTCDPALMIRELSGRTYETIVFTGRAAAERVFILVNTPPDKALELAENMFVKLTALSALPKTLCVVSGPVEYGDLASAIRAARKQVYMQIGLYRSALLAGPCPEEVPASRAGATAASRLPELLVEALCVRNEKQIGAAVGQIVDAAITGSVTQTAFEDMLESVIHDRRLDFETKAFREELSETILSAASADVLKVDLTQVFSWHVLGEGKSELRGRVEQIEKYLSAHFTEEISSETLSARFGFVPSYLSKVFRRQTGMSPTEYLSRKRMEKAMELLATNPGLLIRDAAAYVGYKDPYYFSKLFKKFTGLWPSQYQEEAFSKEL